VDKKRKHFGIGCNNITTKNQPLICANRHARSLETKWEMIKHNLSKFVGCHRSLVALNEFGTFVEDTLPKALKFYENKHPKQ
jgi:hypothetical protein